VITGARRFADTILATRLVGGAVRALANARGHRLILVYHRIAPCESAADQVIVPTVSPELFRDHVRALTEVIDLVGLDTLLDERDPRRSRGRAAVALTFDDDLPSHVEYALPILEELRVPATFFLSGRALLGLGAYWFQDLEVIVRTFGTARAAELLNAGPADLTELALRCQADAELRQRVRDCAAALHPARVLDRAGIERLRHAGMPIGFHTASHDALPPLNDGELTQVLHRGRTELESAAATTIAYFAYPYGQADARTAHAVRGAGFVAAFTGQPSPVRQGVDPYRIGRWEPGAVSVPRLLAALAVRLHRIGRPASGEPHA